MEKNYNMIDRETEESDEIWTCNAMHANIEEA